MDNYLSVELYQRGKKKQDNQNWCSRKKFEVGKKKLNERVEVKNMQKVRECGRLKLEPKRITILMYKSLSKYSYFSYLMKQKIVFCRL